MNYKTNGTCSTAITFDVEDNKVRNVKFKSGCNGNLQGISILVEGLDVDFVIEKFSNVNCNGKGTSCPDQLARALKEYVKQNNV